MNQSVFKTLEYAKIITMLQNMATSSMGKMNLLKNYYQVAILTK